MARSTSIPTTLPVYWDDQKIMAQAGNNPESVAALLSKYGQGEPSAAAIYQWVSRRSIASEWRAPLVYCLMADKLLDVTDLFRVGSPKRRDQAPPALLVGQL